MKRRLLLLLVIASLLLCSCSQSVNYGDIIPEEFSSDETASFHFIDVGQGDCILIQDAETNILIDAGTTASGSEILAYLENLGIDYLDCFIGTHPHEDHLGGGSAILSELEVENVYLTGETSNSYFFERLVDTIIEKEITPVRPDFDKEYQFGKFSVEFLSPKVDFGDTNNNSLVTMITYGDIKALFTGDSERPVESELVKNGTDIKADILKVGHHGSRNGTSKEFLASVNPAVAVIQCGKDNSYGHPHEEALNRLQALDINIMRTDEKGTIILHTDGESVFTNLGEGIESKKDAPELEITYTGNKKSKVFHCETCPNLPKESNRVIFSTREDAEKANYTPCGNCMP